MNRRQPALLSQVTTFLDLYPPSFHILPTPTPTSAFVSHRSKYMGVGPRFRISHFPIWAWLFMQIFQIPTVLRQYVSSFPSLFYAPPKSTPFCFNRFHPLLLFQAGRRGPVFIFIFWPFRSTGHWPRSLSYATLCVRKITRPGALRSLQCARYLPQVFRQTLPCWESVAGAGLGAKFSRGKPAPADAGAAQNKFISQRN